MKPVLGSKKTGFLNLETGLKQTVSKNRFSGSKKTGSGFSITSSINRVFEDMKTGAAACWLL